MSAHPTGRRPWLVVEFGARIGCGICGSLLAQAGAAIVFVEAEAGRARTGKFAHRPQLAAGKLSIAAGDRAFLRRVIAAADAVLVSSDLDPDWIAELLPTTGGPLVCDMTAFGKDGTLAGQAFSDGLVQAIGGLMETTGLPDGPPRAVAAPILEMSAALYAASAVIAALRAAPGGERLDVALYDCAVNALATFLPAHFGGAAPHRLGNRHAMAAPWNAYHAADGWVLICATGDRHWQRICEAIGQPELAIDARYATLDGRMMHRDAVDGIIGGWAAHYSAADCIAALGRAGVACGPIVTVAGLRAEPNLQHRRTLREVADPADPSGGSVLLPAPLIRADGAAPDPVIPAPDGSRGEIERLLTGRAVALPAACARPPLDGLRVVEIGQFTTAPLCGRHLAMLGADVVKLEPPEGDTARLWAPHRDGQSYFFVLSNSGKRSVALDLRSEAGAGFLHDLLTRADVLVENMKPGSLARLGFSADRLAEINPRLVYCAISGFGADAAYPGRPAFDTVAQAMSGLMDLTRDGEVPLKSGISIADICAGELALVATLAALARRDATGKGCALDLSMQDAAAWLTQLSWAGEATHGPVVLECRDGFVAAEDAPDPGLLAEGPALSRDEMVERLAATGIASVRVQTIAEVVAHPHTVARALIREAGPTRWPLLASPMRFATTPLRPGLPIGAAESWTQAYAEAFLATTWPAAAT